MHRYYLSRDDSTRSRFCTRARLRQIIAMLLSRRFSTATSDDLQATSSFSYQVSTIVGCIRGYADTPCPPGQEDIESLQSSLKAYLPALRKESPKSLELLIAPLYAKLSPQEQAKAFVITPPNTRKVILATNVAETSVTIPGVKYVVDTGMAKEKEYHASVGESLTAPGAIRS